VGTGMGERPIRDISGDLPRRGGCGGGTVPGYQT
jgi:hypothetical protein